MGMLDEVHPLADYCLPGLVHAIARIYGEDICKPIWSFYIYFLNMSGEPIAYLRLYSPKIPFC